MAPNEQPVLPGEVAFGDLEQLFIAEQPKNLWPTNQNSNLGALRKVVTGVLGIATTQLSELALERFIATASGYLSRWELEVGLPQFPAGKTDSERAALVSGRLKKGPFTRTRRREIVEAHMQATFGTPVSLTPEGLALTGDGIALFSEGGALADLYEIVEDVEGFSYTVYIDPSATPDMLSLERELNYITPAHINFSIVTGLPPADPGSGSTFGAGEFGEGTFGA